LAEEVDGGLNGYILTMIMMPMVMLMSNVLLCWFVLFGLGLLICGVVVSVCSRRFFAHVIIMLLLTLHLL
jgi:hypothetical protein